MAGEFDVWIRNIRAVERQGNRILIGLVAEEYVQEVSLVPASD
jgi:hypothetical protein